MARTGSTSAKSTGDAKPSTKKRTRDENDEEVEHESKEESGEEEEEEQIVTKKKRFDRDEDELQFVEVDTGLLTYSHPECKPSTKIAAFDFDSTLVVTKSGKVFATGPSDWQPFDSKVIPKLKKLHNDGYKVVIFTNQGAIGKGKSTVSEITRRIQGFINATKLPFQVFAATTENHYRKPSTEMWDYMEQYCNGDLKVDKAASFYVGDAAGRPKDWKPKAKKDFSCSDRKFAANIGIAFHTPEEFFLGEKPCTKFSWEGIDPSKITTEIEPYKTETLVSNQQEMVLFVGFPASGKSTFAKRHFLPKGYVHINMDTLGTKAKCLKAAREAIDAGKSVVIDNTNPDKASRAEYIAIAKAKNVPVRCFLFKVDQELAEHLNMYRERMSKGAHKHVPSVAYNTYKKRLAEPTLNEGFTEIKEIDFVPVFDNETHKTKFYQFTG